MAGLDGDVGARTDGDADIGGGQRGGVVDAVFRLLLPSLMTPSTGTLSPGRTSTRSPSASSLTDTSSVSPSVMRVALSGKSLANSLSAPLALEIERISIQWPSNMMVTSVASSHHNGEASKPSSTATLKTKATVIASEMSVIIPGIRISRFVVAAIGVLPARIVLTALGVVVVRVLVGHLTSFSHLVPSPHSASPQSCRSRFFSSNSS